MEAKSDQKTKKCALLRWKCGDWIEIVESERKSGTIFVTSIMQDLQETPEKANDTTATPLGKAFFKLNQQERERDCKGVD